MGGGRRGTSKKLDHKNAIKHENIGVPPRYPNPSTPLKRI
jgi:hypothetical protein